MSYTTVVTAPAHEPVTLDELKEQENIPLDTTDHDVLLWRFIRTAGQACEAWTGKRLVTQTRDFTFDAFPPQDDE
ncbi:MAG: phage head-tail connector protein, partial [Proteobacteria bacterium]|nr:phage head-tail connector protein [Pseudomonadota bacterium]